MRNSAELDKFLNLLIREKLQEKRQYRASRKELIRLIGESLLSEGLSEDPALTFEEWESKLSSTTMVDDYVTKYSPFTETFIVQWLPSWENIGWAAEIRQNDLNNELKQTIGLLGFDEFERMMKRIFEATTWTKDIRITKSTRDDGIDFAGKFVERQSHLELPLLGQAKHWKSKVGSPAIRDFLGSISLRSRRLPTVGIFVSTSGFSDDAWRTIRLSPARIIPYDMDGLVELMVKNKVGVSRVSITGLKVDRSFWADIRA